MSFIVDLQSWSLADGSASVWMHFQERPCALLCPTLMSGQFLSCATWWPLSSDPDKKKKNLARVRQHTECHSINQQYTKEQNYHFHHLLLCIVECAWTTKFLFQSPLSSLVLEVLFCSSRIFWSVLICYSRYCSCLWSLENLSYNHQIAAGVHVFWSRTPEIPTLNYWLLTWDFCTWSNKHCIMGRVGASFFFYF